MKEKAVIFLDIDGVLNQLQPNYFIDLDCVEVLSKLVEKLNADVVLTSTWRLGYSNTGKCTPQVEKLKLIFNKYNIKIVGRTSKLGDRSKEIQEYIDKHRTSEYLILDDDMEEFKSGLLNNTFLVNSRTGLRGYKVKDIIKH